ncbi:MAG: PqqD family protein [Defluviitaleaceae bacterium]|nr:PqqD family protein [Defluviitaleaceae bacterium]
MYRKKPGIVTESLDGCVYIFDLDNDLTHDLNEVAAEIWELINEKSIEEIINVLVDKYDVDSSVIKNDVYNFVNNAVGAGILIDDSQPR